MMKMPDGIKITCSLDQYLSYQEDEQRRFYVMDEIDKDDGCDVLDITNSIADINREDKDIPVEERKPIYLYISSEGGRVDQGFALVAAIELSKTPVYTISFGQCASMAFLLAIAGHKRFALPYTQFLMHDGWSGASDSVNKLVDYGEFLKRWKEEVKKPYVLKHSKMTEEKYESIKRAEFYMLPEDAMKYGFIDEIITDLNSFEKQAG